MHELALAANSHLRNCVTLDGIAQFIDLIHPQCARKNGANTMYWWDALSHVRLDSKKMEWATFTVRQCELNKPQKLTERLNDFLSNGE
jgi:hypothetical protein